MLAVLSPLQLVMLQLQDTCANEYTVTRTFTATDACGNTATASQVITVEDNTAPVFNTVPAAATIECPANTKLWYCNCYDACGTVRPLHLSDATATGYMC